MHHSGSAVVSFIIGHVTGSLRGLHLLEEIGMIPFFDPKEIAQIIMLGPVPPACG